MVACLDGCCYHDNVGYMLCARDNVTQQDVLTALEARDRKPYAALPYKEHPEIADAAHRLVYRGDIYFPSCSAAALTSYTTRHFNLFSDDLFGFLNKVLDRCQAK